MQDTFRTPDGDVAWTRPDYAGRGIANLMASLIEAFGAPGETSAVAASDLVPAGRLASARHVVLLIIDGMGRAQLERHAPGGVLGGARVGDLSSVFPSTTASAVTTFMTGDVPATHGLTGWHLWFRNLGVVGAPLPFRVRGSDVSLARLGVDARTLFATRPLSGRLARRTVLVHPRYLCGTPYTEAHRGAAEVRAFTGLDGLVQRVTELCREKEPSFCYAYWPELDSLSHVHGSDSAQAGAHLQALDQALEACVARVRGSGALILVSADHGFVDTRAEERLGLEAHPPLAGALAVPLCGEPRMAFCYVRAGAESDFTGYLDEHLAHAVAWHAAGDVLASGCLGPGVWHPDLVSRLGTHVLFMKGRYCLTDRVAGERHPFTQVGVHGGMTDAELRVPVCVLDA